MKKSVFVLLVVCAAMSSCQTQKNGSQSSYNLLSNDFRNVPLQNKTFDTGSFSGISVGSVMKVVIRKSAENKVVVTSNAMQYVVVRNVGGILRLTYDTPRKGLNNVNTEVVVYTDGFRSLKGSSAAKITMDEGLQLKQLSVELDGAAKLEGGITAQQLAIELDGAAKINTKVKGSELKVKLDGASKLSADIDVSKLVVDADSASKSSFFGRAEDVNVEAGNVSKVDITKLSLQTLHTQTSTLAKISR